MRASKPRRIDCSAVERAAIMQRAREANLPVSRYLVACALTAGRGGPLQGQFRLVLSEDEQRSLVAAVKRMEEETARLPTIEERVSPATAEASRMIDALQSLMPDPEAGEPEADSVSEILRILSEPGPMSSMRDVVVPWLLIRQLHAAAPGGPGMDAVLKSIHAQIATVRDDTARALDEAGPRSESQRPRRPAACRTSGPAGQRAFIEALLEKLAEVLARRQPSYLGTAMLLQSVLRCAAGKADS